MNQTAKKLRDIAQNAGVTPGSGKPYSVIATIKSAFGFDSILAAGVLLQFMAAIADELDELQARAAGANNLRQQLESAEKKAERRKKHIGYLDTAFHDKNVLFKQRGEALAKVTEENAELRKQVPTERERQILAMWPKFEDGEPVWFGDKVNEICGEVSSVYIDDDAISIYSKESDHLHLSVGERVERHVQSVLDADGVEIKVGDSMYVANNGDGPYTVCNIDENIDRIELFWHTNRNERLFIQADRITHIAPDSWERLEEDAEFNDETGIVGGNLDIVRRAKALAGAEVSE